MRLDSLTDKPSQAGRSIDWKGAISASVIAGLIFALLEMMAANVFQQSPWPPLHMIAAIVMGKSALAASTSFDLGAVMTAVLLHMALAILYGVILAYIIAPMKRSVAVLSGAVFGLALYIINFYGFTAWFPWYIEARGWKSAITHMRKVD